MLARNIETTNYHETKIIPFPHELPNETVFLGGVISTLKSMPELIDRSVAYRRPIDSIHTHWNFTNYALMALDERYRPHLEALIWKDFVTFTDEGMVPSYKISYLYGVSGLPQTYLDHPELYAHRFINQQSYRHQEEERAVIEAEAWKKLAFWLEQAKTSAIPRNAQYAWISPHGTKAEGYLGTDSTHPHLISIYTKTARSVVLTQFKSWASYTQLERLQLNLSLVSEPATEATNSPRNQLIAKNGPLTQPLTESVIEQLIYADPDEPEIAWPVNRSHLPSVNLKNFEAVREAAFEQYLLWINTYLIVIRDRAPHNPYYFQSSEFSQLLKDHDTLFSVLGQTLLGWIKNNDQRPISSRYQSELVRSINEDHRTKSVRAPSPSTQTPAAISQFLNKAFTMFLDKNHGKQFSATEVRHFNKLSNFYMLQKAGDLIGLGQCVSFQYLSADFLATSNKFVTIQGVKIPSELAKKEGWLKRKGLCANKNCRNPKTLKGEAVHLGNCHWCSLCDDRFTHPTIQNKTGSPQGSLRPRRFDPLPPARPLFTNDSISLTQLFAGDVSA